MTSIKPLIRWAGSKRRFTKQILEHLPARIDSYFEPFLGSGAVLLELHNQGRLTKGAEITIGEQGPVLDMWRALLTDPDELATAVVTLFSAMSEDRYRFAVILLRSDSTVERAAAFLYLNKTSFNGLFRCSVKSGFNVPRDPNAVPPKDMHDQIRALVRMLHCYRVTIANGWESAQVVYADPPYHETWCGYTATPFSVDDQRTLAERAIRASARGAHVVLSNNDTPLIRELYGSHFELLELTRSNVISCKASTRKTGKSELLMVPLASQPHADVETRIGPVLDSKQQRKTHA